MYSLALVIHIISPYFYQKMKRWKKNRRENRKEIKIYFNKIYLSRFIQRYQKINCENLSNFSFEYLSYGVVAAVGDDVRGAKDGAGDSGFG